MNYLELLNADVSLKTLGSSIHCNKMARVMPFECFGKNLGEINFLLMNFHKKFDVLLGIDFIIKVGGVIDINRRKFIFGNNYLPIFLNDQEQDDHVSYFSQIPDDLETNDRMEFTSNLDDLNAEEKCKVKEILYQYRDIFLTKGSQLTFTNAIKHRIVVTDDRPVYCNSYRYPIYFREEINKQINELLQQGIIRHSRSPYNSPLWIVPKKTDSKGNKQYRMVVDYRKLNMITKDDKFPIPIMDCILDKLGNCNYFTTIDLAKGFHQVEVDPRDVEKTAFSTEQGHFEWLRMPFGLKGAPATFQRLMNSILADYIGFICFVYLDDIFIYSSSLEEHVSSIKKIFNRLREHNLKIQPDKCQFMRRETVFLGHIVTEQGVLPNPDKIKPIVDFKIPKTRKEISRFLGMVGFYRKFIKDFAKIAKPLTSCLKEGAKINSNDTDFLNSVNTLKKLISTHPILKYPEFNVPFVVTCDASQYAIGAVLSQKGQPVSFASRTLCDSEIKYSVIEKELLAIAWGVKEFRHYIYGKKFTVETDHKPLVAFRSMQDTSEVIERLKGKLGAYDFEIKYIKGRSNYVADALSRDPTSFVIEDQQEQEIDTMATIHSANEDNLNMIEISFKPLNVFKVQLILLVGPASESVRNTGGRRIITLSYPEYTEEVCSEIISNKIPNCSKVALLMEMLEEFVLFQNTYNRLKPPFKIIRCTSRLTEIESEDEAIEIINKEHIRLNHRGINNVIQELERRFYIEHLRNRVQQVINNCHVCSVSKYERTPVKIPYKITETPEKPRDIFHIDIWYPKKGTFYLSAIDKFSKFATLTQITSRNWITIKDALAMIFITMGHPRLIVCDHEKAMETESIKNFLDSHNISLHLGTPDNKSSNADVERLHNTINEHMRLIKNKPAHEKLFEDPVVESIYTYNNTIHSATGHRPIELHNSTDVNLFKGISEKVKEYKTRKIAKLNQLRNNENVDFQLIKNHKVVKLDNWYRRVNPTNITSTHARVNNKNHYKARFKKRRKFKISVGSDPEEGGVTPRA